MPCCERVCSTDGNAHRYLCWAEEYRTVIESDVTVALQLLQTVSGHLSSAAVALQEARAGKPDPEA